MNFYYETTIFYRSIVRNYVDVSYNIISIDQRHFVLIKMTHNFVIYENDVRNYFPNIRKYALFLYYKSVDKMQTRLVCYLNRLLFPQTCNILVK